ncbi:indigoidine synthase A-like protein, putative [Candida dubliniensis CD36]|uniref:Indigoidine synthase A-like protein, putative n=1 Tax=Candida dubliniensis (strain CD36 / ATCC MYA-646 / CBS 7987 / NCPF 3949 / NRRL Y-17841) TaxID=573826 RepID=B9WF09_CANDC|nr:indigoidine synthase A-like protein, putative [Candida dubliniensis CD36]CAX43273.1 indigoidine synthase A-like protein, putative [Candida dubliniensis CD36]
MIKRSILRISQEVTKALKEQRPVVALESTIITHGLPYPQNIEMAKSVEQVLRDKGVVPATCAFIEGVPHVGINDFEGLSNAVKVSRRDIGYVMANKLNGGTTVASTMILSHLAGIKVFATGGLGGVHRDGQFSMDVSADLMELGKTPVSVVCAGPKSILDIGLTMEYLETQGVFVGTYNPEKLDNVQVPGFYCRESGVISPYGFESFAEAAQIGHYQAMVGSGSVFCIPPPKETAMDSKVVGDIIERANQKAKELGVSGKQLTPFLLSEIATSTQGKSVESNISLVKNNASAAAEIAKEMVRMVVPSVLVVGSVALDTMAKLGPGSKMGDSNIGTVRSSIGGVGYNIAKASGYVNGNTKFVSKVGDDVGGRTIQEQVPGLGIGRGRTAQYVSMHDSSGELIVACADMEIAEEMEVNDKAGVAVYDCNLSSETVSKALPNNEYNIIEPTSHVKARRIGKMEVGVFPNNRVKLITPTVAELSSIHESMRDKFDDEWFGVLDAMQVDQIRDRLDKRWYDKGVYQQCFQLLPFFQNILVKLGKDGVLLVSLCTTVEDYRSIPTTSPYRPKSIVYSRGRGVGAVVEYFPIPKENENIEVDNVTGAGDALVGYLAGKLSESNWLNHEIGSVEQVWGKWESIYKAQLAAGLTIRGRSQEIANI